MRLIFFCWLLTFSVNSVKAQETPTPGQKPITGANPDAPVLTFINGDSYDFGDIKEGPVAEHVFLFQNTGKDPLIIKNAVANCGCTTPEYSRVPVKQYELGKIKVRYDTKNRFGSFNKTIYVNSNAVKPPGKNFYELHVYGIVNGGGKKDSTSKK